MGSGLPVDQCPLASLLQGIDPITLQSLVGDLLSGGSRGGGGNAEESLPRSQASAPNTSTDAGAGTERDPNALSAMLVSLMKGMDPIVLQALLGSVMHGGTQRSNSMGGQSVAANTTANG